MKSCNKCNIIKELKDFHKCKRNKSGYVGCCKICAEIRNKIIRKRFKENNPEKHKEYFREYGRKWRNNNRDRLRDTTYKREFGISLNEYNEMVKKQNNLCAICKKPETTIDPRYGTVKNLLVDHCHKTGKIRGLLCRHCNTGIGLLGENKETFINALIYLDLMEDRQYGQNSKKKTK